MPENVAREEDTKDDRDVGSKHHEEIALPHSGLGDFLLRLHHRVL